MSSAPAGEVTIVAVDVRSIGGMERQLTELIVGLLDRGWRVTVVARTCDLPSHPRLTHRRVPVPGRPFALGYPLFLLAASAIVALRGRGVVHATGAIVLGRVDVVTIHLCHAAARRRMGAARTRRAGRAYRLNAAVVGRLAVAMERRLYRPSRTRRVVSVSPGLADEVRAAYPAVGDRLQVVPNGVDRARFRPDAEARATVRAELRLQASERVAIFVAGEWEQKGLGHVLDALPQAAGWTLVVVGNEDGGAMRARAEGLGVADRVRFVGPRTDVERLFAAADAFVLPTAYETFSLVTYEAAASGLPLLVTDVSGVTDILDDGVTGWRIERSAASIAAGLERLVDADVRARMGTAARAAVEPFGWDAVVDAYADLYRGLQA